jgi:adenylate kinase
MNPRLFISSALVYDHFRQNMHRIFILGPQGCGKGTQATILSEYLGIPHLSMGHLLREETQMNGELSDKIRDILNSGSLVPDVIVKQVLLKRLALPDARDGYILDGFPRNIEQFMAFEDCEQPTAVLVITIPRNVSIERLSRRAEVENRTDDTPDVIARRLDIYEADTLPMIEEYRKRGIVRDVDGTGSIEAVAEEIKRSFVL